ncbi:MAG: bifunctional diaminohydroxyphosphoribosylaminopyrimidine deaminase/5-amino-6-(5-phosphoribosylamino)uracil reductase RibD [Rhodococcus sp.]|nr:bifunctional diaminohydroxyphosphoribosylaminopyrimidine deaminase/5-amino-6-(5-phosphoribosylamino)uracil reductase RibD [Rhodococcus sp. (in: high G+C Gram-positive bacteria)]
MLIAIEAAESARGFSSPNPPVGAVILAAGGTIAGVGMTQPPGGPHAEVVALRQAGAAAKGGTAVVTLEPCNHHGRTGPCAQALVEAGIAAVHYAIADPNPEAAGGAGALEKAGIEVTQGARAEAVARGPLRAWLHKQRTGRPHVTWKYAATLDGRSAAADGTSQWITGPAARARVHEDRAKLDAILVGTGTVIADDPWLTARTADGSLAARQPLRVVVGTRDIPAGSRILDDAAPTLHLRTHDVREVIDTLTDLTDVLVEGGPRLAGAFLAADGVDRIQAFVAPVILGSGAAAIGDIGVQTIGDARTFRRESVETIGPDTLLSLVRDGDSLIRD